MKTTSISIVLSLLVFTIGCTPKKQITIVDVMNSWTGSHISEVIRQWGPATEITTDGKGGFVYIWRPIPKPLPKIPPPSTTHGVIDTTRILIQIQRLEIQAYNESCKMFYARPDGIIYYWRAR